MIARNIDHLFNSIEFRKSSAQIKTAAAFKAEKVKQKIAEREKRIRELRAEHEIEDSDLIQLLTAARKNAGANQYTYSKMSKSKVGPSSMEEKTIGAGVVNNLLSENDYIEAEKDQVKVLERIMRNIKPNPKYSEDGTELPEQQFKLTPDELDYLEF